MKFRTFKVYTKKESMLLSIESHALGIKSNWFNPKFLYTKAIKKSRFRHAHAHTGTAG